MYIKYIGPKLYFIFLLSTISAILEGFGITLLLPLLSSIDSEFSGGEIQNLLVTFLQKMGALTTGHIILLISVIFLLKGLFKFFEGSYATRLQSHLFYKLKKQMFYEMACIS